MILANHRIPIAEDEILDYLIEGVTNRRLRDQAHLMNYHTGADLLKAFEKVQLDHRGSSDVKARRDGARTTNGGKMEALSTRGKPTRCYKYRETGHIAVQCGRVSAERACYVCKSTEHLARECPKRSRISAPGASRGLIQTYCAFDRAMTLVARQDSNRRSAK